MIMEKRLYRSRDEKKIAGVCGGVGEYFGLDPNLIRIITVVLALADGIGIVAYIVAWILMPLRPFGMEPAEPVKHNLQIKRTWPGVLLVALGVIFLLKNIYWWFDFWDFFLPAVLIAVGIALILHKHRKTDDMPNHAENIHGVSS